MCAFDRCKGERAERGHGEHLAFKVKAPAFGVGSLKDSAYRKQQSRDTDWNDHEEGAPPTGDINQETADRRSTDHAKAIAARPDANSAPPLLGIRIRDGSKLRAKSAARARLQDR